jgi:hypothetical protein
MVASGGECPAEAAQALTAPPCNPLTQQGDINVAITAEYLLGR